MPRWLALVLAAAAFGAGMVVGILGLTWATGGTDEPSQDIAEVVPTLSLDDPTPSSLEIKIDALSTQVANLSAQVEAQGQQIAAINIPPAVVTAEPGENTETAPTETPAPEATPEATEAASAESAAAPTEERALFRIDKEQSEVRFRINEVLGGLDNEVVGVTREVAGDIIVSYVDASASQVGSIGINARTFRTDNDFRNDSIRGQILQTNTYEFITFEPTRIENLPTEALQPGQTVEFQVVGNLTIKDVTREVTFEVSVEIVSTTEISGLATTEILYPDFDITIRTPPTVSDVEDNVILELEFVATKVEE